MKKELKRHVSPETITADSLRSYKAAISDLGCDQKLEVGRWADSRVENSYLSLRRRERVMLRLRRIKSLQKFASAHANVHNHSNQDVISSIISSAARPHWPNGSRSWPEACRGRGEFCRTETSCH
jgi:transposase-like protein